jgi:hypothetical protein
VPLPCLSPYDESAVPHNDFVTIAKGTVSGRHGADTLPPNVSSESLTGTDEFALDVGPRHKLLSPDQRVLVDARGPGEWIVRSPAGGRSLHIYRLGAGDWLVSEVGLGNEGRGADLQQALSVLSAGGVQPDWWDVAANGLSPVVM